jgi:hypothetical protein
MGVFALVAGCGADDAQAEPSSPATVTVTAQPTTSPTPEAPEPSGPTTDETTDETTATPTPTPAPAPTTPTPEPVDLSAYDLPGFTTPSGNIGCLFDHYRSPHVRCDRLRMDGVPTPVPADCDFDWGHSVELSAGGRAALACTSDSVMGLQGETDGTRVLPYGDSVRYRGIVCTSTRQGLRCQTSGGHGFLLSKATIRVR